MTLRINSGFDLNTVLKNEEARRKNLAEQEAEKARQDLLKGKLETNRQPAQTPTEPSTRSSTPTTGNGGLIEKVSDGVYLYTNIDYAGSTIPAVELTTRLLDGGNSHTQAEWLQHHDKTGFIVPDAELLYQFMHRNYQLRNDNTAAGKLAQEITQQLRQQYDAHYLMTLTNINYGQGLNATVKRLMPLGLTTPDQNLQIPTFNDRFEVLAPEQAESELGTNCTPTNAQPVLATLLGANSNEAPQVFQYTASRRNKNLRETRLWTPNQNYRPCERVVCLGVYSIGRFNFVLGAGDVIVGDRPALGVRQAQKISSGKKGAQ